MEQPLDYLSIVVVMTVYLSYCSLGLTASPLQLETSQHLHCLRVVRRGGGLVRNCCFGSLEFQVFVFMSFFDSSWTTPMKIKVGALLDLETNSLFRYFTLLYSESSQTQRLNRHHLKEAKHQRHYGSSLILRIGCPLLLDCVSFLNQQLNGTIRYFEKYLREGVPDERSYPRLNAFV